MTRLLKFMGRVSFVKFCGYTALNCYFAQCCFLHVNSLVNIVNTGFQGFLFFVNLQKVT